jgi:tetratricopeptide (TPR) repeat protein
MLLLLLALAGAPDDSVRARLAALRAAMAAGRADSVEVALAARRAASPDRATWLESGTFAAIRYEERSRGFFVRAMADTLQVRDVIDGESAVWLGALAYRAGDGRAAERWYARAAEGARSHGDPHGLSEALVHRVQLAMRQGERARALVLIDSADAVLASADSLGRAEAACQRSQLFAFLSRHEEADSAARFGIALAAALNERELAGGCLAGLGTAQAQRGMLFIADTTLAAAVDLLRQAGSPRTLGSALQWRGYVLRELTRLGEADSLLRAALAIAERIGERSLEGWSRLNLGLTHQSIGDHEAARRELEPAAAAFDGQLDAWGRYSARLALAFAQRELALLEEADANATAVVGWARRAGNAWLEMLGWVQRGAIAEARGDWEAAGRLIDSAGVVVRRARLSDPELAVGYHRARVQLRGGDAAGAVAGFRDYLRRLQGFVPARQYAARARLSEALAATGDVAGAARSLLEASDALDAWRDSLDVESLRRAVFATGVDDPDPDLGVATVIARLAQAGHVEAALTLAEHRRARALVDQLVRTAASARGGAGPVGVLLRERRTPTDWRDLHAALPDDAAAVLFVTGRGGEPTSAFVLARGITRWVPIQGRDSLAPRIARLRALLAAGGSAPVAALEDLGAALVAPWWNLLPRGTQRLVLIPDDVLHHVPFDALPAGGAPLGHRIAISLAPSLSTLALLRARPRLPHAGTVLVFADAPATASADPDERRRDTGFHPLPGARREARRIERRVSGTEVFVGREATESALRERGGEATVLHLATHALVDERSPLKTWVALAPGGGHDGRLTPAEVAVMPLRAELVVLSACRTATGRLLAGEGTEGLTAPFLAAGARAVVATRWDVSDAATAKVMERFYEELLEGRSAGDALHLATQDARARGEPMTVWAAFTLVGDPMASPVLAERRRNAWPLAGAAGLALAAAAAWAVRRRNALKVGRSRLAASSERSRPA